MLTIVRPAVVLLLVLTALTGLAYPLAITGITQIGLPANSNGSLIRRGDTVVGSDLIGQSFTSDRYFHGRPSAAGENGYDATASSGSNLGPTSRKLIDRVASNVAQLAAPIPVPADSVTTSASGLDPHISPAFAALQIDRIAAARSIPADAVKSLVDRYIERPFAGLIGEPRVNVLQLNLALDAM